jgi:ADP-ribosyltransferase exoenzyme
VDGKVADAYPTITKDGVEGVYDYTTHNYHGINPYLRDVDELSLQQRGILEAPSINEMTDEQRAAWEAKIEKTDEGLAALPPYRTDPDALTSTTWRGIQASDALLDQFKLGDTFTDPGYLSTTTNPQVAEAFARANPDATATLVTVVGRDGVDVIQLSRYMDESEVLFPRSAQFEVVFREMGPTASCE